MCQYQGFYGKLFDPACFQLQRGGMGSEKNIFRFPRQKLFFCVASHNLTSARSFSDWDIPLAHFLPFLSLMSFPHLKHGLLTCLSGEE